MKQEEEFRKELLERILCRLRTFVGTKATNNPYEDYSTIYLDRYGNLSSHIGTPPGYEGHGEEILLIPYRCIPEHGDSETEAIQHYLSWAEGELLQEAERLVEDILKQS